MLGRFYMERVEHLLYEPEETGILWIRFNRPERMNALAPDTVEKVGEYMRAGDADVLPVEDAEDAVRPDAASADVLKDRLRDLGFPPQVSATLPEAPRQARQAVAGDAQAAGGAAGFETTGGAEGETLAVVPAQAGTHTPQLIEGTAEYGSRHSRKRARPGRRGIAAIHF